MSQVLRFPSSVKRDPDVDAWMKAHSEELGEIARQWFEIMRDCGNDVRELLHDGHPTACVADAAFAYVNAFKSHVNVGFFRGAELYDPKGLLDGTGKFMRHVKLRPDGRVDAKALKKLIELAYTDMKKRLKAQSKGLSAAEPVLLTGGNPQIAKADGDAPVQAYIAAMPGWKRDVGRRLDAFIVRNAPNVRKAVRWNSPFYGIEGQGWFLGFHVFTHYVKVTFFRGTSLRPVPPGGTSKDARWIDIHEDDLDEAQLATWIRQAAALPGWGKA
jgi:hypothetical protein